ncbi:hypothetical protein OHA21_11440 [Actinoplanes sp. NBC_00393]|uniref:hypothetical protein n=1 Tax=Actinoplanes sp. NBC_00393 TaxID=2975953 RepID=UPI002E2139F9
MTRFRILPAALAGACLLSLAACDSADPAEKAAPPAAAASSAPAVASGARDQALCKTMSSAGSDMKGGISQAQQADGSVKPADAKKSFSAFHATVTEALAGTGESDVVTAARALAEEIAAAARTDDPIATAADSDFEKLSGDLTTACEAAGVTVNF